MNLKLTTPAAVAAALAGMLATAPALAADYAQAPGAGSILVFATKYDGEVFTGSFLASRPSSASTRPTRLPVRWMW